MSENDPDTLAGEWAKRVIRAEMARQGIGYRELAARMGVFGLSEEERALRNKVARATFSAGFFIQCLAAMDVKTVEIDLLNIWRDVVSGIRSPMAEKRGRMLKKGRKEI